MIVNFTIRVYPQTQQGPVSVLMRILLAPVVSRTSLRMSTLTVAADMPADHTLRAYA
jgi:hypothetical protein